MTFAEAMAVVDAGGVVSREVAYNGETYNFTVYRLEGVLRVDSGEMVGALGWVPSTDETDATDWVSVT